MSEYRPANESLERSSMEARLNRCIREVFSYGTNLSLTGDALDPEKAQRFLKVSLGDMLRSLDQAATLGMSFDQGVVGYSQKLTERFPDIVADIRREEAERARVLELQKEIKEKYPGIGTKII